MAKRNKCEAADITNYLGTLFQFFACQDPENNSDDALTFLNSPSKHHEQSIILIKLFYNLKLRYTI